jgi:vacuolar-type H+-ATPase subunit E/Vma4
MENYSPDQLLRYFEDEINKNSDREIEEILKELVALKSKELAKIDLEVKQQVALSQGVKLKEIKDAQRAEINRLVTENSEKLAKRRDEIAAEIFAAVTARIAGFVASEEYPVHVAAKAKDAADVVGRKDLVFHIAPKDEAARVCLGKLFPDAGILDDPHIRLGGFSVTGASAGVEIDETFDARLSNLRTWFLAHSQLFIRY